MQKRPGVNPASSERLNRPCRYIRGQRLQTLVLHGLQVVCRGLAAAAVRDDVETDFLAFAKVRHASPLDGADMDENVPAAIFRSDEAISLLGVEPFDSTRAHDDFLSIDIDKPAALMQQALNFYRNCRRESSKAI